MGEGRAVSQQAPLPQGEEGAKTCRKERGADVPVALVVRVAAGGRAEVPLAARSKLPAVCSTRPKLHCNPAGLLAVVLPLPLGHFELVSYSTLPMLLYNPVGDLAAGQAGSVDLASCSIPPML